MDTEEKALSHWISHGKSEGRICNAESNQKYNEK